MKTIISPRAEKQLKGVNKIDQISLAKKIRQLASSETQNTKLRGYRNIFRVRVGPYRIIYKKTSREVYIIAIGHRKEIYKVLERMLK